MNKSVLLLLVLLNLLHARMVVTTTLYPIYSIAKEVGGNAIELRHFVPFGVEPHEFEPSPKEVSGLKNAHLFLYSGHVLEPWSTKVIDALAIKSRAVDMSRYVTLRQVTKRSYDPHYWLSFDNYLLMIEATANLFAKTDPQNTKLYRANADGYIAKVKAMQAQYAKTLSSCKNHKILVNHDAFGYVAHDYNLTQLYVSGMSPEDQPSAKQIAKLVDIVKKDKINVVFFEEFASDKVAKTIAKEAGVKTDSMRPAENITEEENRRNFGYLDIMSQNLTKLKGALNCP